MVSFELAGAMLKGQEEEEERRGDGGELPIL